MDRSARPCVFVTYMHGVHVRDDKRKLPFPLPLPTHLFCNPGAVSVSRIPAKSLQTHTHTHTHPGCARCDDTLSAVKALTALPGTVPPHPGLHHSSPLNPNQHHHILGFLLSHSSSLQPFWICHLCCCAAQTKPPLLVLPTLPHD